MKKLFKTVLVIAAIAASATTASARSSYRGFVEVDPAISITHSQPDKYDLKFAESFSRASVLVSTTHGVQLSRSFFVGAGLGINTIDDGSFFFPIYGALRWDMNITSKVSPFVSCKLGICFGSRDDTDTTYFTTPSDDRVDLCPRSKYSFFYYQPTVGVRFRLHHHIGLNVGVTLMPTAYTLITEYNTPQYEDSHFNCLNFGVNVGIDF